MGVGPRAAALLAPPLAWIAGVALQLRRPELESPAVDAALAVGGIVAALLALALRRRGGTRASQSAGAVLLAAAFAAGGYASTGWRAAERLADRLDAALEGQDLLVEAVVDGLPAQADGGLRVPLHLVAGHRIGDPRPLRLPARALVNWTAPEGEPDVLAGVRAGQAWRLALRLRRPHGLANPGGFDAELWLFEQGIGATGSVRSPRGAPAERLPDPPGPNVDGWRQDVRDAIARRVHDRAAAGVLAALSVGDQSAIVRGDWDVFRATGVAHLMSTKCFAKHNYL